jgi:hypothetical protein
MNAVSLIHLNVGLEYETVTSDNLIVPFQGSSEQSRCIIHKHSGGYECFLRHDLPVALREKLLSFPPETLFSEREYIKTLLAPCNDLWIGKSYTFKTLPNSSLFPGVVKAGHQWIIEANRQPVSWAWSVRENQFAAELAVETLPGFQRHGYARQVVLAWAHEIVSQGRVAFYSHNHDNFASQALAHNLGLVPYTEGVAYE